MAELGSKGVTAGKIASNVQKKLTRAQEKRITCDWLWKKQQEMIICVAPHVPALLGQATSCIPAWPWRAAFLNLSPASDPLLLSPSGSWRSNC